MEATTLDVGEARPGRKRSRHKSTSPAQSKNNPPPAPPAPPATPADPASEPNFILTRFSTEQTDFTQNPFNLPQGWTVNDDTLEYSDGNNRGEEKTKRERLIAVLGPGATIRGVAQILTPLFNKVATPALPVDTVTKALAQYNSWALAPGAKTLWNVGVALPLPIERLDNQQKLVVNIAKLKDLATKFTGTAQQLANPVADLAIPAPETVTQDVTAKKNAASSPANRAAQFAAAFVVNPFDVVFEAIETMRQYAGGPGRPDGQTADERAFAVAFVNAFSDWQVVQLGRLTGGNAVLRRVWRGLRHQNGLTDPSADVLSRVGTALGLNLDAQGKWHDPTYYFIEEQEARAIVVPTGPTVVPLELRILDSHRSKFNGSVLVKANRQNVVNEHLMILGRDLDVGRKNLYKQQSIWGAEHNGDINPDKFLASGVGGKDTASAAIAKARLGPAIAISAGEGGLDAVRSSDKGLLSFGFQQWTMNDNTEGTTCLHRFRMMAPDHFDLFFGRHGMQTVLSPRTEVADPEAGNGRVAAERDNPFWINPTTFVIGGPSHVTLRVVKAGVDITHANTKLPPDTGSNHGRRDFFGGKVRRGFTFMDNDWCARSRLAALLSLDFQMNQLQFATLRFDRIVALNKSYAIPTTTQRKTLQQLFSSEFGAAAILDTHIHVPGNIDISVDRALQRTKGTALDASTPTGLGNDWAQRFVINFMAGRKIDADKIANRNQVLLQAHDAKISPQPSSFLGW